MKTTNKSPINYEIKSRRVILIDEEGTKRGEFLRDDAIKMAKEADLDLVLVSSSNPPVCKMMDYGKFLYQQKKKSKKNTSTKLKEVKLTPVTDTHDFEVRLKRARDFLEKGHKVKVTMVFKGRHRFFKEQGADRCREFYTELEDIASMEGPIQSSGRFMNMILVRRSE